MLLRRQTESKPQPSQFSGEASSQTMEDEEESISLNPNGTLTLIRNPSESLDPAQQKKHAAMLERLANRHQTRLETLNSKSTDSESSSTPAFESTASFLSRFADSKRSIEARIAQCRLSHTSDATQLKPQIGSISASISDLEKLVAENSYFLPSYEVRSSLKAISDLKQSLENLSSELVPKKKFSFKNKVAKKDPVTDSKMEEEKPKEAEKMGFTVPASPGFRNKTGEVLVKKFEGSEVGEFTISDLDSCEVRLMGCVRALFIHRLRNCKIHLGPVMGSILIDGVDGCVFVMASHQIRIHYAKKSDFYLRVRSRPIIEDCNGLRFAPYCLSYEGVDGDLKNANLDEETGNWSNVDDFRWLRAVQSPNWSILPENERIGLIEISDKGISGEED